MSKQPEFIGDYKVLSELGRGAMVVVYLCLQPTLGRHLAVKVMAPQVSDEPDFVERFRREGEMAAKLRHPNIVQVYDQSSRDGVYFIAMEYLGSRTLKSLIRESGPRPLPEACRLVDQLLGALEHAHAHGVVHRDIKPANIMLTDKGEIALTDFSIAYSAGSQKLTQTGTALGTPEYMAPEQFDGKSDARSDLYASALILYELLTGFSPFRADTLSEVMKKQILSHPEPLSSVDFTVPESLSQVVARALRKQPEERYSSAAEMRQSLLAALQQNKPVLCATCQQPVADCRCSQAPTPRPFKKGPAFTLAVLLLLAGSFALLPSTPGAVASPAPTATASLQVIAQATPLPRPAPAVETPVLSSPREASVTPTAEPSFTPLPSETAAPVLAPAFPGTALFRPGSGVDQLNLGDSMDRVESVWGRPLDEYADPSDELVVIWAYGNDTANLFFEKATSKLIRIAIYAPDYTLDQAPEVKLGADQETVLRHLPDPTSRNDSQLDFDNLGICFNFWSPGGRSETPIFGVGRCEAIIVYEPGQTKWK